MNMLLLDWQYQLVMLRLQATAELSATPAAPNPTAAADGPEPVATDLWLIHTHACTHTSSHASNNRFKLIAAAYRAAAAAQRHRGVESTCAAAQPCS